MKIAALAGGVGGAKLADGLYRALPAGDLTIIVNTGDDFDHFGLWICPDLDTVCYALAGLANPQTGWGQANETWQALDTIARLGGPDWFHLGDRDLGLHLERTRLLREGKTLTEVTGRFCKAWGIAAKVLPMTDQAVPTIVNTVEDGELTFQEYFVHRRCEPQVTGFRFEGADGAAPSPGVIAALQEADAIVICPSNPWVSIGPILSIPGYRQLIAERPVVAVSPIIGGKALKGPAAKMYQELGMEASVLTVAQHYGALLSGLVIDRIDREYAGMIGQSCIIPLVTETVMVTPGDRQRLAVEILDFCSQFARNYPGGK